MSQLGNYSDILEIIDIINQNGVGQPFEGLIRKLDKEIGQRPKFADIDDMIVTSCDTADDMPGQVTPPDDKAEPRTLQASPESMFMYGFLKERKTDEKPKSTNPSPKASRIKNLVGKIEKISTFFEAKKNQILTEKFTKSEVIFSKLLQKKMGENFRKLVNELKHQSLDQLRRKVVKPNYATMIKFAKTNLPEGMNKTERLLLRSVRRNILQEIRSYVVCLKVRESCLRIMKQAVMSSLRANAIESIESRRRDRVMSFIVRLDTYLVLLKYQSFFNIKSYR